LQVSGSGLEGFQLPNHHHSCIVAGPCVPVRKNEEEEGCPGALQE
jgi:hypothetical protein